MFKKFFDKFWPKAIEYVAEQGLNNVGNIKDFEHNMETLQKNLKLLSAKAYDVEEEIKNGECSGRKKRKREVEEWLEDVRSIETEVDELGSQVESQGSVIMRLMDGGGKAAQLNMQVERLVQQRLDFGEPVLDTRGTREEILLTNGMVGEASNENLETVMKLLESRQVSKIGVYGMGGVGKTTLAKHIYNRLMQQSQGRVFWITVSQEFTVKSLQDKVARCLGVDLSDEDEEVIRAGRLNRYFTQLKDSVLILDDVWERIDMSKVGCTFSAEGCRLIITTRSLEVCRQIGCTKLISVVKLFEDEAWKLFNETLGNETELGPQVEEIAKSLTMLCGGLPLGIITVAGSMKGQTAIYTWQNALAELEECVRGQDETGEVEEVFKVLKYSFDRLKRKSDRESYGFNMIQHCFLYCSLYPEDYEISRDDLARRFISEGLVDGRSRRAQVEQGLTILDKLVNLCLLESCVGHYNREYVKMHDLVRSMALRICKGKYLVRAGDYYLEEIPNEEEWTKDLEKVSLMQCSIERIGEGFSPDCPNLSTFLLSGNYGLNVIPESFFSKMQGLCTLDFCGNSEIAMLPDSISDLTCLKSLLLEECKRLEKVPYLGKMKALRELNLSKTAIKEVPAGVDELLNLRFLSMNADGLKRLPSGVFLKLVHLEHLNIPLDIQVSTEEIKNLKRLEEFHGGVKSISDFNMFVKSRAPDRCYRLRLSQWYEGSPVNNGAAILEMGWANNNELVLQDCDLKDEKVLVKGFMDLKIEGFNGLIKWFVDDFCGGTEWITRSEDVHLSNSLEEIVLSGLDDLKGVVGVMERERGGIGIVVAAAQPPVFSSLKSLHISRCKKMRKLGLPVSALPNLEEINIWNCEEVEEIFEEEKDEGRDFSTILPKLKKLKLYKLPRLRKVGLPAASGVPNLEEIDISGCGEVEEIFEKEKEDEGRDSVTTLPKLKKLKLYKLARLRKVGLPAASGVPNLEEISIESCGEIQEIFEEEEEDEGRDSAATLSKLRELKLNKLPRLRKVGLLAASGVPNLEVIWIGLCDEIQEIFEDGGRDSATTLPKLRVLELQHLPRLRKVGLPAASGVPNLELIDISGCGEIQEIFEDEDERRDSATTLPKSKLRKLMLYYLPRLRKVGLPAASGVPNLEEIWIDECAEVQEIFEDGGRDSATTLLPKLRLLTLRNLARLRKVGLPAASGVPNLELIDIQSCGEIQEIFEDEDEDERRDSATTLPKSKLRELRLNELPRLRKVGLAAASGFPNLEVIWIGLCDEIQEIFEDEDEGRAAAASTLPKLRRFILRDLPRLKRVSKATIISNSIQTILIRKCPELKNRLPLHFDGPALPPSLGNMWVDRGWWETLEWDNPLLPQLFHPFLELED